MIWEMLVGKKINIFIILLLMISCNEQEQASSSLSQKIRKKYQIHMKPLDKINYLNLFGGIPQPAELELGRMLFNDPILSRNNDVSCASCHLANHGFADGNDLNVGALGAGGPNGSNVGQKQFEGITSKNRHFGDDGFGFKANRKMFRNSLSTINVAHRVNKNSDSGLLWDGRFGDILFQILLPIHTPEELCGYNPLPLEGENIFKEAGPLFDKPVTIEHSHFVDTYTGKNENLFNYKKFTVKGIPRFRKNGQLTVPNRNECLALAIAKLRKIPAYRKLFKKAYGSENINDKKLASALVAFTLTHVSKNTPYDQFVKGENSMSKNELKGMSIFLSKYGEELDFEGQKLKGMGCVECHKPPTFDSHRFETLGVISDELSSLSRPQFVSDSNSGFFNRPEGQRGKPPECHKVGKTFLSDSQYAPDIGRASASFSDKDCFKFRVPTLRNVLSTFPYFHHGSEKAQSLKTSSFKDKAMRGLKNTIKYHIRGPIDPGLATRGDYTKTYFDDLFQRDLLIPYYNLNFGFNSEDTRADFSDEEINYVYEFIANSLYDPMATIEGDLGNDVSHPKRVPSGLFPSITRDQGHQFEITPNMLIKEEK